MTIGTQLHRAVIEEQYDTIVIGSGMSGLTTAVCLAKSGQKVLVLERHYTAGGFTHTYQRKGYEWDVGLHYIGEVHKKHSTVRRMFDYVSDGQLQWAPMDPVYDRIVLGNETFDFVQGSAAFKERMHQYFPEEKKAIDAYVKLIKKVSWVAAPFFFERALPPWLAKPLYKRLTTPFLDYARKTTGEVLQNLTKNQKLISVLSGQWGDYGLPPEQSSFAMHALVAKHYLDGANYPVGGSASIARTLSDALGKKGCSIITNAEVSSIIIESGEAKGVKLANGRIVRAKNVVSSVGVSNTFERLLADHEKISREFQDKVQNVAPSFSHLCLCIGLKVNTSELGIETSNLWLYPNEKHDENIKRYLAEPDLDFPVVYISFPSAKDPRWLAEQPNKGTIEIVVPAPYAWFEKWAGRNWQKRGEDYNALKKAITDRLLSILIGRFPQLEGKIHFTELSTPLSTVHFSNYQKGEIYGIDHTPERFKQRWLRTDTSLKNFYLTGQDIVTCGVAGALSAGFLTSVRILGPLRSLRLLPLMLPQKSPPRGNLA